MANNRSWTWLDETDEKTQEANEALVKELTQRWNNLNNELESRLFVKQARYEEGYDDFYDEEDPAAETRMRARDRADLLMRDALEQQLHDLGARMMRPYEHWNEDERLMEYMERDRGY